MVTAISSAVPRAITRRAAPPRTSSNPQRRRRVVDWAFFAFPDFSDEMCARISEAHAWPAVVAVCRAVHDQAWRGRTKAAREAACENDMVGVGIHALARDLGVDESTMRRQLDRLEALGVIVIHRRGCVLVRDEQTGKVRSNRVGRTPAALVYLTISPDALRPRSGGAKRDQHETVGGAECAPPPRHDRVQNAPPSQYVPNTLPGRTGAAQDADTPQAPPEAGRHSPAQAGGLAAADHEGVTEPVVNAGQHGEPVVNAEGRPTTSNVDAPPAERLREGREQAGDPQRHDRRDRQADRPPTRTTRSPGAGGAEDWGPPPAPWPDADREALERTRRRLEAEKAARDREDALALQARQAAAVDALRAAAADLTPDQRERAAEAVENADTSQADADARLVNNAIARRLAQDGLARQRDAAAFKAACRDAYVRDLAADAA